MYYLHLFCILNKQIRIEMYKLVIAKFPTLFLVVAPCFAANVNQKDSASNIYMISSGEDKIGKGKTYNFSDESGISDAWVIQPPTNKYLSGFSLVHYNANNESWLFKFVVPAEQNIVKEKLYKNAVSYPYQSPDQSGIKACPIEQDFNDLIGEFKILDYALDKQGEVSSLAIDFEQVSNKKGKLNGSIRYHSSIPITTDFEKQQETFQETFTNYSLKFFSQAGVNNVGSFISHVPFAVWLLDDDAIRFNAFEDLWYLEFAAPNGKKLEKGQYYGARAYPLVGTPQMDFVYHGLGLNQVYGCFEVLEIVYGNGVIEKAAIDFVLRSEIPNSPRVRGSVRYKTKVPPSSEEEIKARLE